MAYFIKIAFAAILSVTCINMLVFTSNAEGTSCQSVVGSLGPCGDYLSHGGAVSSACCNGVKSLYSSATTTALRRSICECLKTQAKAAGINPQYAASLPTKCNVNVGYPISYTTNCNSIQ